MRARITPRTVVLIAALVCAAGAFAVAFLPLVRAAVATEANRRHLVVQFRTARPTWWGVNLVDVAVAPEGVTAVAGRAERLRVGLGWGLRPDLIEIDGGELTITGTEAVVRDQLGSWRKRHEGAGVRQPSSSRVAVVVRNAAVRWNDGEAPKPRLDAEGVSLEYREGALRLRANDAHARLGPASLIATNAVAELSRAGALTRARSERLVVEWTTSDASPPDSSARPEPEPARSPSDSQAVAVRASASASSRAPRRRAAPSTETAAPHISFPDTHALRGRVGVLTAALADRIPEGADVGVDALTWKLDRQGDKVAFTVGPGPFTVDRLRSGIKARFSTNPGGAGAAMAFTASLPTDGSDSTIALEGGPISLALMGIREGALGLMDVAHATLSGRARMALAGDGGALSFDLDGSTSGMSLENPRLATEPIRGLDVRLRSRGTLTDAGELRIDHFEAGLGAVQLTTSGTVVRDPEHLEGAFRFEVARASCQSLLESVPAALLPVLRGSQMTGTFGATGRLAFDTRALDDLTLEYDVQDHCALSEVPEALGREQFEHPFVHRVYLADGTTGEQTTGPGTPNWTPLAEISPYMQVAVLTTEDGAFFHHHGFNRASIRASLIANLKAGRFVRGASTITMQLAKNLFLDRQKTLSRKLEEMILTDYLEQTFSKDELMELYLNVIEFGPSVYGITEAADYYFGRTPGELNLAECLFLSSLLPSPLRYGSMRDGGEVPDGWMRLLHSLMEIAHKMNRITDAELNQAEGEPVLFWRGGDRPAARPVVQVRSPFDGSGDDVNALPAFDEGADSP